MKSGQWPTPASGLTFITAEIIFSSLFFPASLNFPPDIVILHASSEMREKLSAAAMQTIKEKKTPNPGLTNQSTKNQISRMGYNWIIFGLIAAFVLISYDMTRVQRVHFQTNINK